MNSNQVVDGFYQVRRAPADVVRKIPPRRGPIRPIPGLTMAEARDVMLRALEHDGFSEYNACWTFEPRRRAIPFMTTDPKPQRVHDQFERYVGAIFDVVVPQIKAKKQTINKISAGGWPLNANPKTHLETQNICARLGLHLPRAMNKFDLIVGLFPELDAGDISRYHESFGTWNERLQYEPPSKEREGLFIADDGSIYKDVITQEDRTEYVAELGEDVVGSRARGVLNPALINLYLQCWDTLLHSAIMSFPLCYSNVYNHRKYPGSTHFMTFDCKHYERYLGKLVFAYADAVGGRYAEWMTKLATDPHLVPSDTRKTAWLIKPIIKQGQYPQLGSGLSLVATVGKLGNLAVQTGYFVDTYKMNAHDAVLTALMGEHDGLSREMYGDDNRLRGPKAKCEHFIDYVKDYFDIEVDEWPKYLGTKWRPDVEEFMLPASTFDLKMYLRERDYEWYSYPSLGFIERRDTFRQFGEPEIAKDIIPYQDALFNSIDKPIIGMISEAQEEMRQANSLGVTLSKEEVTDKEYLLTPEEQIASGRFWGFEEARTTQIARSLVSKTINEKLRI